MVNVMWKQSVRGRINAEIPMKKGSFTEAQITGLLRQAEARTLAPELGREHGLTAEHSKDGASRTAAWMGPS